MNPGHRRRLASTYEHMDDLLRKAEAMLAEHQTSLRELTSAAAKLPRHRRS